MLKKNIFQIIEPSSELKKNKLSKVRDTECLFGENLNVVKTDKDWSFVVCLEDKYKGWIKSNTYGTRQLTTHIVSSVRSFILIKPDIKSEIIHYLPIRSKVKIVKIEKNWAKIKLNENKKYKFGYILKSNIIKKNDFKVNWVKYSELLMSVPYRWGGRDSFGIDCSALLQLTYAFTGKTLPRDSVDQLKFFKNNSNYTIKSSRELHFFSRGNIIYWEGHIAIIKNKKYLIHASGFHGKVITEKIDEVIRRIDKDYYLIKEN